MIVIFSPRKGAKDTPAWWRRASQDPFARRQSHKVTDWKQPPSCLSFLEMVAKYENKQAVTGVHMGINVHLIKSL